MTSTTLPQGWYRLTKDVKNPHADRRRKTMDSVTVWKKGTVVYFKEKTDHALAQVEFPDGSYAYCGGGTSDPDWIKVYGQGNAILEAVEAVPVTVGRFLKKAWSEPRQILAALVEKGIITLEQIQATDKELEEMPEDEFDDFGKKHNVLFVPYNDE